jgi:hypothetical protein
MSTNKISQTERPKDPTIVGCWLWLLRRKSVQFMWQMKGQCLADASCDLLGCDIMHFGFLRHGCIML